MPPTGSNPVEHSYDIPPPQLSSKTFHISGILATVFGLDELRPQMTETACLWLLHPRLQTQACMQPFAASSIAHWNGRVGEVSDGNGQPPKSPFKQRHQKGLIAVSFDQRNHGSREVDKLANQTWRGGNPRHAQDMFSQIHGTAADTSILLDFLASYIFPDDSIKIIQNLVFGVSLGGHAAWQVLLREPRITAGIVGIGCPDYLCLMMDRARLSKLADWDSSDPTNFLGSASFPKSLIAAVDKHDPAGLIKMGLEHIRVEEDLHGISDEEKVKVSMILDRTLRGKRMLLMSGGTDKLVPYECSKPFLAILKQVIATSYSGGDVYLKDCVFDEVGHEISGGMVQELHRFVTESLEVEVETSDSSFRSSTVESKI